jgi:uncharacterized protein (TIGR03032 family)
LWRAPSQAATLWPDADRIDARLLSFTTYGRWWETLHEGRITLLVTREYEHLIVAITATNTGPLVTFMPLPHPSGVAVNRATGGVYVASTRNPNQVYEFRPAVPSAVAAIRGGTVGGRLLPVRSWLYPGRLYLHDLAFIRGVLHGNAVGQNAIVTLAGPPASAVWWPRSIERTRDPDFRHNYLQLNSIAAGSRIDTSFFSASADTIGRLRPGHARFPVDRRGVVFSGRTREPVVRGLTRPHSARLHRRTLWVANSGYGELGTCDVTRGSFSTVARPGGWTRGLSFKDDVGFVGTSRVIPRFRAYAPGLDTGSSVCGVHAIDARTGSNLGGLIWPEGNQIFAVEWIDREQAGGLPFLAARRRSTRAERDLFYNYRVADTPSTGT